MRTLSLVSSCAFLTLAVACGDDSSGSSGGELDSPERVQSFFQAIMPELVAGFTELANEQSFSLSASTITKGNRSVVPCPDGGSIEVDVNTGAAALIGCSARGVVIDAELTLFVTPGPSFSASFNGLLMVTGSFTGTIEVIQAFIQWTEPATDENTYWEVTILLDDSAVTVTSGDSFGGGECSPVNLPGGQFSVPPNGACDDDSDCQSGSCRDPITNPAEGCTCRNLDGGPTADCNACLGLNGAPPGAPADPAVFCDDAIDFSCRCDLQSGQSTFFAISAGGACVF